MRPRRPKARSSRSWSSRAPPQRSPRRRFFPLASASWRPRRESFPEDTYVRFTYGPTLRALCALNRRETIKAFDRLQSTLPYELALPWTRLFGGFGSLYPVYVRGNAYLDSHRGAEAAVEFQKILDHRGIVLADPVGALARLQLGRALALSGDLVNAKAAYDYWYGAAVQKSMPTALHGIVQAIIMMLLEKAGWNTASEVRLKIVSDAEPVPDVIAVRGKFRGRYPVAAPELCIEIMSPEDTLAKTLKKANSYVSWGSQCVWIIDPEKQTAWALSVSVLNMKRIPSAKVLAGFALDGSTFV